MKHSQVGYETESTITLLLAIAANYTHVSFRALIYIKYTCTYYVF